MTTGQSTNRGAVRCEFSPNDAPSKTASCIPVKPLPGQFDHLRFLAEEYEHLGETLKYRTEEFRRVIRETEQMPRQPQNCERCPRLERRSKNQMALMTRLMNLVMISADFIPRTHPSYEKCMKEFNELKQLMSRPDGKIIIDNQTQSNTIAVESSLKRDEVTTIEQTRTAVRFDETVLDTTLKCTPPNAGSMANRTDCWDENRIAKCSERANGEISPIVERSRNNKRRLKCISTKKRSKSENGETRVDRDSDSEFPDFEVISCSSKSRAETPDVLNVQNSRIDHVETPPTGDVRDDPSLSIDDIIEPTQKVPNRRVGNRGRRSLLFSKPSLNDATIEQLPDAKSKAPAEKTSPLNVVITSNGNSAICGSVVTSPGKSINTKKNADEVEEWVFKNSKAQVNGTEQKKLETKWTLAPSRQPTNSKLKQTLLSMATVPRKTDITKQEKFNGGLLRSAETTKKTENETKPSKKVYDENSVPPSFDPAITSTANDVVFKTPVKNDKVDKFAKYANNNVVDNSFDVIPKTSPDYKYKRDAVRKQCERRKLPGQRCDCCAHYYEGLAKDIGETQAQVMQDKFSRHRDKNALVDTLPGLWNPVIDTNDEMLVMSRH